MSRKEWLELLLKTSREGGFPSVGYCEESESTGCLYRGEDGRKCAVGLLIPDEKYGRYLENERACEDVVLSQLPEWCREDAQLITTVQNAHDRLATISRAADWDHAQFVYFLSLERPIREAFESEGVVLA